MHKFPLLDNGKLLPSNPLFKGPSAQNKPHLFNYLLAWLSQQLGPALPCSVGLGFLIPLKQVSGEGEV